MQKSKLRKGLVLGIIVLFIGASVVPSTCSNTRKKVENLLPLGSGLVAYWNFDEGTGNILHDVSGNGNDGTIYGAQWVNGTPGYGLDFDGVDDYVELPPISQITNIPINQISLAGWIYLRTTSGPEQFMEAHTTTHEILLEKCADSSEIEFDITDDDGFFHSVSTSTLSLNSWHFIVGTYNGTTHCVYADGVLENTSTWSNTFTITTGFTLAKDYEQSGQFLDGILDEVRIFEKSLNSSEVEYLYNNSGVGDIVYVDDDFDDNTTGWQIDHFDKIQDGIDTVNVNGTVYVYNGTYYENVVVDKTINLMGEDRNTTIIDGGGSGDVVYVSADWVNITGFSMRNSGSSPFQDAGLDISLSSNCNVEDCLFFNNGYAGIQVFSASDCQLVKCHVYQNLEGMFILNSNNIQILDCICNDTGNGIRVDSAGCWNVNIVNCTTYNNIGSGIIFIQGASNNNVAGCISYNNSYGISFYKSGTTNNNCFNCTIFENEVGIRCNRSADNNLIYHNNLINNIMNTVDECNNTWNDSYPSGGNYWSDYTGDDLYSGPNQDIPGPDGIGDTPYNITGGDNQDMYPLMHPFEMYYVLNITAPSDVYEDIGFLVIVKSIGGTAIPDAFVGFNNEIKRTNLYGQVYFRAPLVETDTFYNITVTKEGYTGDTETILVKDVPVEFVSTFIFGRIDNLTTGGDVITFEAVNIRCVTFFPFTFNGYTSGELITISKNPFGFLGALLGVQLIFALCSASI